MKLYENLKLVEEKILDMTNYTIGRTFEYKVINHLRRNGYYCIRAYGSKGAIDILAIPKDENPVCAILEKIMPLSIKKDLITISHYFKHTMLIQAKKNGYVPPKEREKLAQIPYPVYIAQPRGKDVFLKRFLDDKT